MAETKLISIIVPIYNVEQYLGKCVDSLFATAGIERTEIILIDDGSTDGSGLLADSYAERYDYVTCYHKTNGGLSDARNYGIKKATGKYVFFFDSDDMIISDAFKSVIEAAEVNDADILQWDGVCIDTEDNEITTDYSRRIVHRGLSDDGKVITGLDMIKTQLESVKDCPFVVWLRAYKRSYLEQNGFQFEKGWIHEDELWSPVVLTKAESVLYLPKKVYCYRVREYSIMTTFDTDRDMHAGIIVNIMRRQNEYYSTEIKDEKDRTMLLAHWARKYMGEITKFELYKCECSKYIPKRDILKASRGFKDRLRALCLCMFGVRGYSMLFLAVKGGRI